MFIEVNRFIDIINLPNSDMSNIELETTFTKPLIINKNYILTVSPDTALYYDTNNGEKKEIEVSLIILCHKFKHIHKIVVNERYENLSRRLFPWTTTVRSTSDSVSNFSVYQSE